MKSSSDRYKECMDRITKDLVECDRILAEEGLTDSCWNRSVAHVLFELNAKYTKLKLPFIPKFINYLKG